MANRAAAETAETTAEEGGDGDVYTIDELAGLTGVPSRTIRFYQSKGTLPSPQRKGRVALYGPEHVDRLKLIAELQDRGLRLDAIRDVLGELEVGRRLAAELARHRASGSRRRGATTSPRC